LGLPARELAHASAMVITRPAMGSSLSGQALVPGVIPVGDRLDHA
jgi:hypothetical protein